MPEPEAASWIAEEDIAVVGADNPAIAHQWYRWDEIRRLVPIHVIGRQGYPRVPGILGLPRVSSTDVRRLLAAGESVDHLVPASVLAIIAREGLYRTVGGVRNG